MKKALRKSTSRCWHFVDNLRVDGCHARLRGDASGLRGNVSDLWGDVSDLSGNVSGLRGNVSGLSGDVDDCGLSDHERAAGVNIADLYE